LEARAWITHKKANAETVSIGDVRVVKLIDAPSIGIIDGMLAV
jgi:hypothetical protein